MGQESISSVVSLTNQMKREGKEVLNPTDLSRIRYEPLTKKTLAGAMTCADHAFSQKEPLGAYLGITPEEMSVYTRAFFPSQIDPQLSLVAVDVETEDVVGVTISEDFYCQKEPPPIPGLSPKLSRVFALLETLGDRFRERHRVSPGHYFHLMMIAVRDTHQGRGIGHTMSKMSFQLAKERGFAYAVAEATGSISQHILRNKYDFQVLNEITYADFRYGGERPFLNLVDPPSIQLVRKNLSEILSPRKKGVKMCKLGSMQVGVRHDY